MYIFKNNKGDKLRKEARLGVYIFPAHYFFHISTYVINMFFSIGERKNAESKPLYAFSPYPQK